MKYISYGKVSSKSLTVFRKKIDAVTLG